MTRLCCNTMTIISYAAMLIAMGATFIGACATLYAETPDVKLDLRPIETVPEPMGELHPELKWLETEKVRGTWIGVDLFDTYEGSSQTVGRVLADAGFNLVVLYTGVDRTQRDTAPGLEDRIRKSVVEARKTGLKVLAKWQFGSTHHEPYRRYRESGGRLHELTCCPLDSDYIERHVGRWAEKCATYGADGFVFDTEMYESDVTTYSGPCVCDDCFSRYLKTFSTDWKTHFDQVAPEVRGVWINDAGAVEHYTRYFTQRVEAQFDALRARCHAINPAFLFGYAPFMDSFAGLTRGLGTASNPCLIFSEQEYTSGPTPQAIANVKRVRRDGLPALYLSGLMIFHQSPDALAENALAGSLYGDGWWAWYGGALLHHVGTDDPDAFKSPYGRVAGTTAAQYLGQLAAAHRRLDELLGQPSDTWPAMRRVVPLPSVGVPRRRGEVTVDGRLDDEAWSHAAQVNLAMTRHGALTTVNTIVRLCWDNDALYVAGESELPDGRSIDVPERGRDNAKLWEFDGMEIFLAPQQSQTRYAQIQVSALGDVCDILVDVEAGTGKYGTPAWNTDLKPAATHDSRRYVVEIRIPFKDFAQTPQIGERWNANFYRFVPEEAAWSPTYGGFHSPARFGALTFVGASR